MSYMILTIPNVDIISVTDAIHRDWERDLKIVEERIMNIEGESRRCILMQPIWEENPIQTLSGWWIEGVGSELGPLNPNRSLGFMSG